MNANLSSKDILELAMSKHEKHDLLGAGKLYQEVLNKDSINTYLNYKGFLDKRGPKYSWWPS